MTAQKHTTLGWRSKDDVPMGPFVLRLYTGKSSRGLTSRATAHKLDGAFEVHRVYTDYSQSYIDSRPPRITQKSVEAQHAEFLKMLPAVYKAARLHYENIGEATDIPEIPVAA